MTKAEELIQIARQLGGATVTGEDEAVAFCLNRPDKGIRAEAFALLHEKYYDITLKYLKQRSPESSATSAEMIADRTFDRIWVYSARQEVRATNGSLGAFVNLVCEWELKRAYVREKRRRGLLTENFQKLWFVQRDEADSYRDDSLSDQDMEGLMSAIRRSFDAVLHPRTIFMLQAISAIFINTNGLQVRGMPASPSISAVKRYLENNGKPMTEEEIKRRLQVLRAKAKSVLEENGWDLERRLSKYAS